MRLRLTKTELKSKKKTREKFNDYLSRLMVSQYTEDEIFYLILSAIRANDWNIDSISRKGRAEYHNINIERIKDWLENKVIPNTVEIKADEVDLLKLLVFSLAMPYKMLKSQTRATMTEKVRRTKKRNFEQIFSDHFIGKIGEIAFRKFVRQKFNRDINLDWEIGTEISTFKSDVIGASKIVNIKSTDTLESIWAEAPTTADYGIFVKVALPKDFFLKILAHISSLRKLLSFANTRFKEGLSANDNVFDLVKFIENSAYDEELRIKGFICGYFETSNNNLKNMGEMLDYLGEVHGDKHLVPFNELKYTEEDYRSLFDKLLL